jgi:hypothetical protein
MQTRIYKVEKRALLEVPVYREHRRARNWAATILELDPKSPGGIRREFWERGQGKFFYIIPERLALPAPVEIAADYYNSRGEKWPRRWYGVLIEITSSEAVFEEVASAEEAIRRAKELRERGSLTQDERRYQ